jgi:hypothetical protein
MTWFVAGICIMYARPGASITILSAYSHDNGNDNFFIKQWDEQIKWNYMRWGKVNNNVNEEDLKCQHNDSLFSDTVEVSP